MSPVFHFVSVIPRKETTDILIYLGIIILLSTLAGTQMGVNDEFFREKLAAFGVKNIPNLMLSPESYWR